MSNDALLTAQEVADELRVTRRTVYNLCASGVLRSIRIGTRRTAIRIRRSDLNEYVQHHESLWA